MPVSDTATSLLFKVATPDLYRRNAFRLTGLPVTASAREVARQADKLKMLADLGGQAAQQLSVIPGMESPTAEEVRAATQRLKDVEARALDEFFWFWPEDWEKPESDEAFAAIKRHDLDSAFAIWANREVETESFIASRNIALVLHMRSIEWALLDFSHPLDADRLEKVHGYWKESFGRWEWLADDDRLWDAFKARIRQINDPALTTGYARRLRSELPQAFDKINAELALTYAEKGRRAEAQWHVDFLKSTHSGQDDVSVTLDAILGPSRVRIERVVESAWQATKADKRSGTTQARKLLDATEPLLAVFNIFHETDSAERCQLFDEVAEAALGCAVTGYNTSNQALQNQPSHLGYAIDPKKVVNKAFLDVLHRAEVLATDLDLRQRISQNINTAQGNLQFDTKVKPFLERLKEIQEQVGSEPSALLQQMESDVIPMLDSLFRPGILGDSMQVEICDSVAVVLRGIALSANNEHNSPWIGLKALDLALSYAKAPDLVTRLNQDRKVMLKNAESESPRLTPAWRVSPHAEPEGSSKGYLRILFAVIGLMLLMSFSINYYYGSSNYQYQSRDQAKQITNSAESAPEYGLHALPTIPTAPTTRFDYRPSPSAYASLPTHTPPDPIKKPTLESPKVAAPLAEWQLAPDVWHTLQNQEGREISAKVDSFDGANVVLTTISGTHIYPINKLSLASQLLVRELDELRKRPKPQRLPSTGVLRGYVDQSSLTGPLTIKTRSGSGNYYVKLVEKNTGIMRMVIFIQEGETTSEISVPSGTYEMRYATGSTWYGEDVLFGDDTTYNKADSDFTFGNGLGYSVELYLQQFGNLETRRLNKNNF